ncbi:MAG: hypothetical protein NZ772_07670 [Cyanobacteria bacterium]|nr:hypothetical protein [Cyanobacteriota bacterium]
MVNTRQFITDCNIKDFAIVTWIVTWHPLASLLHISHTYCGQICALLVPMNMAATIASMMLVGTEASMQRIRAVAVLGISLAVMMVMHVLSWLLVGVVMLPTYVLLCLAGACFSINIMLIYEQPILRRLLVKAMQVITRYWPRHRAHPSEG